MKYFLVVIFIVCGFWSNAQSVANKADLYLDVMWGYRGYAVCTDRDSNVSLIIITVDSIKGNIDNSYGDAVKIGTVILDFVVYDSCNAFDMVNVNCKKGNDTLGISVFMTTDQIRAYKKGKEFYTFKEKCDLLKAATFLKYDDYLIEKDTIVFYCGTQDAKEVSRSLDYKMDSLAKFIQGYLFRGQKKMFVMVEFYDKERICRYTYNREGVRIFYDVLLLPKNK